VSFVCDGCENELEGPRVVFSTEATDARGIDVVVAKRWIACKDCADDVFERIGEPSPWSDEDFKTLVLPDEEAASQHMGGYASNLAR
jgi:hypothetical protein